MKLQKLSFSTFKESMKGLKCKQDMKKMHLDFLIQGPTKKWIIHFVKVKITSPFTHRQVSTHHFNLQMINLMC